MDIKLKDFEGPLDLLLHLVSKYQMDIYTVPITEVIEQYLSYIATLQAMKLEVAGEYMLMASQLMLIKSRRLLPKLVEEVVDEEDLEQTLISQLEEYSKFKRISQELGKKHEERAQHFTKPKSELVSEDATLARDKSVIDLFLAFSKVMAEKQEEMRQSHTTIAKDDYKIEDMMQRVLVCFGEKKSLLLEEVFKESKSLNEVITLFLATLELIKIQEMTVEQEVAFGSIRLVRRIDASFS